jgi:hypothetical protein
MQIIYYRGKVQKALDDVASNVFQAPPETQDARRFILERQGLKMQIMSAKPVVG